MAEVSSEVVRLWFTGKLESNDPTLVALGDPCRASAPTMPRADALGYPRKIAGRRQFVERRLILQCGSLSSSGEGWGEGEAFAAVRTTWGGGAQAVLCRNQVAEVE